MHLLVWIEITLGFGLLLMLGAVSVLRDLLERVPYEAHLSRERYAGVVESKLQRCSPGSHGYV
jgi:hypothetical protein